MWKYELINFPFGKREVVKVQPQDSTPPVKLHILTVKHTVKKPRDMQFVLDSKLWARFEEVKGLT